MSSLDSIDYQKFGAGSYGVPNPPPGWRQLTAAEAERAEAPRAMAVSRLKAQHAKNLASAYPRHEIEVQGMMVSRPLAVDETYAVLTSDPEMVAEDEQGLKSDFFSNGRGGICEFARSARVGFEAQIEMMEVVGGLLRTYPEKGIWLVVPADKVGAKIVDPGEILNYSPDKARLEATYAAQKIEELEHNEAASKLPTILPWTELMSQTERESLVRVVWTHPKNWEKVLGEARKVVGPKVRAQQIRATGGVSTQGGKMLVILPWTTRPREVGDVEPKAKWFMPVAEKISKLEYVTLHEAGHLKDKRAFLGERRDHETEWTVGSERDSSGYGVASAKNPFHGDRQAESYAEAFVEWHGSRGQTLDKRVRAVAALEGWIVPVGPEEPAKQGREL